MPVFVGDVELYFRLRIDYVACGRGLALFLLRALYLLLWDVLAWHSNTVTAHFTNRLLFNSPISFISFLYFVALDVDKRMCHLLYRFSWKIFYDFLAQAASIRVSTAIRPTPRSSPFSSITITILFQILGFISLPARRTFKSNLPDAQSI